MTPPIRTLPDNAFVAALDGKMLYYAKQFETPEATAARYAELFGHEPPEVIIVGTWCYCPLRGAGPRRWPATPGRVLP